MAIPHFSPGQPIDISPFDSALPTSRTVALFKTGQLEVMRLVLLAGKSLPPHKVTGEMTIQCQEGRIEITAEGACRTLTANQLMHLSGGAMHSLLALEDASALVTIVLGK